VPKAVAALIARVMSVHSAAQGWKWLMTFVVMCKICSACHIQNCVSVVAELSSMHLHRVCSDSEPSVQGTNLC
jgi:hypothetical protein